MFKKIVVLTQLLFFVHSACISKEIFLHNYLKNGEKDVTTAVYEMLQDARKYKSAKIIIDAGEYHFYPEKAFEKYCSVSNHDNTMRRIAFPLIGFDNLEIEGNNARFIFHGVMMPFDIEDSKNIKISGITIDWHIPLHSEALIVANNQKEGTFDLRISGQYPYVVRGKELIFIKEGYEHDLGNAILFDPKRKAVTYNTSYFTPIEQTSRIPVRNKDQFDYQNYVDIKAPIYAFQDAVWNLEATEIEPGLVRIKTKKPVPPVGMVLVCKGRNGNNRIANAFHIIKSQNVELTNVVIHHAGGMGVIGERSQNIRLEKVTVEASPGKDRMVSTTADATHFVNCRGTILLNNCTFRHMLDDATNVHGSFVIVDKILSKDRIGIRVGHFQQAGFIFAEKGDKIGFINSNESTVPKFTATVKSVEYINDRYYIVTFSESIDREVTPNYVLENLDWYPELVITNNIIADNRARGILLSTPKRTIVENNYFSNMMSAIFIPVELSWWYESGQAQDVIIRNNKFGDCCYGGGKRPVILIHSAIGESDFAFGKIVIENNDFKSFDASVLQANGVRELSFINNKIQNSGSFVPLFPDEPVLKLEQIGRLRLDSNEYDGNLEEKTELNNISFRL